MSNFGALPERDARVIAGNQKLRFFPLAIVAGEGSEIIDHEGRRLLDLSAAWGANSLGHAHPHVVAAIREAAARGSGSSVLSATNPDAVQLAETLLEVTPTGNLGDAGGGAGAGAGAGGGVGAGVSAGAGERRVLLGHSGTDANNSAIAAARAATGRDRVVAFQGGYHGGFGPAQLVSGVFVEAGLAGDPASALLPYPAHAGAELDDVWRLLDRELERGDVAAVIVEPMQSDGGIVVPPAGFLRGLAERTRRAGALLIVDEVKVGLGRTGLLHAFTRDDATPDLVTFGKALGGGLPLSAVVGPAAVLDVAPASSLLTTAGNSVSAAAGRAVLDTVVSERLAHAARERGAQLRDLISEAALPEIREVRGLGLSLGIELNAEPGVAHDDNDGVFTHRVIYRMWQLGVVNYLVRGNVIELTPPLNLSAADALRAVETLHAAVTDVRHGAVSAADIAPYQGW
ncbi:4-aminobutyrate aminotransferase [Leucobacter exalbidus]|uniref:4-aminobutyrate aminotransferase n=1 Tax=Leucobacter exalbidus TaxID=662960 RepID=A0A940T3C3_9MICO|nr:aspartate aminotransferase family protein [Leucobacter exalbidus]MBP1326012.1 4-aminobutyrate aminotransferase [Leucobacter exalbidus]